MTIQFNPYAQKGINDVLERIVYLSRMAGGDRVTPQALEDGYRRMPAGSSDLAVYRYLAREANLILEAQRRQAPAQTPSQPLPVPPARSLTTAEMEAIAKDRQPAITPAAHLPQFPLADPTLTNNNTPPGTPKPKPRPRRKPTATTPTPGGQGRGQT